LVFFPFCNFFFLFASFFFFDRHCSPINLSSIFFLAGFSLLIRVSSSLWFRFLLHDCPFFPRTCAFFCLYSATLLSICSWNFFLPWAVCYVLIIYGILFFFFCPPFCYRSLIPFCIFFPLLCLISFLSPLVSSTPPPFFLSSFLCCSLFCFTFVAVTLTFVFIGLLILIFLTTPFSFVLHWFFPFSLPFSFFPIYCFLICFGDGVSCSLFCLLFSVSPFL